MATTEPPPPPEPAPLIDLASERARRELLRRLHREDWGTITKRLTRYAEKRIGKRPFGQDAKDLAHNAVVHFFANLGAWDQERVPLERHLASVLNGIAANERRIGPNRRKKHDHDDDGGAIQEAPIAELDPERHDAPVREARGERADREDPHEAGVYRPAGSVLARERTGMDSRDEEREHETRDLMAQLWPILQADFVKDALVLDVLELCARGVTDPQEQADKLGKVLLDVLAARRRIERRANRILEELEGSDGR
jgi:hypothetical protein